MATTHTPGQRPNTTRADGPTMPGDAPADTTDPRELVSTILVAGDQAAAAARTGVPAAGYVKTGEVTLLGDRGDVRPYSPPDLYDDGTGDRFEEYEVGGVWLRRNMETGLSERIP